MKTIADIAMTHRQACRRGSLLATAGEDIVAIPTASKKLAPMTSVQNKLLAVEDDIGEFPEADQDEKRRMPN
jgi:hypothetical protein